MIVNNRITLFNEIDNLTSLVPRYSRRQDLDDSKYTPSSALGVVVEGKPELVLTAAGGATGLHSKSFILVDDVLYLAIGEFVVCLSGSDLQLMFSVKMDEATCFALLYDRTHEAFLVHGELLMTRFRRDGQIVWQSGGADIFTGEAEIVDKTLRVSDFNGRKYIFNLETGAEEMA